MTFSSRLSIRCILSQIPVSPFRGIISQHPRQGKTEKKHIDGKRDAKVQYETSICMKRLPLCDELPCEQGAAAL